jgi:hypothetical protein
MPVWFRFQIQSERPAPGSQANAAHALLDIVWVLPELFDWILAP